MQHTSKKKLVISQDGTKEIKMKTVETIVSEFKMGEVLNDLRSKDVLMDIVEQLNDESTRSSTLSQFKTAGKKIVSINQRRDFNTTLNLAIVAIKVKDSIRLDAIEIATLKKVQTFIKWSINSGDTTYEHAKEALAKVYGVGVEYNNNLAKAIRAYKAQHTPKKVNKLHTLTEAKQIIADLTIKDKEALLFQLMEEFGYVESACQAA